ncbi:LTA synthase family protein [Clostridium hydrogeniformans]|uniref:LTA synthase family protein n=1 Tax=Clostridium hydrogeniformans TaxID=349933 RepID=UPI0006925154|nr:LTA synthase family protein [Clostridium hydrogeniformans]
MKIKEKLLKAIPLLVIIALIVKVCIFMGVVRGVKYKIDIHKFYTIYYCLPIICILGLGFLFKGKGKYIYWIVADFILSVMMVLDLALYRVSYDFFGLEKIVFKDLIVKFNGRMLDFKKLDVVFFIDLIVIGIIYFLGREFIVHKRRAILSVVLIVISIGSMKLLEYGADNGKIFNGDYPIYNKSFWNPNIIMGNLGPINYHIYDFKTLIDRLPKNNKEDIKEIDNWLKYNKEDIEDNKYKGKLKGKNVIFLQVESLEEFVIGREIYGQEITPNMNKLLKNSLYFNNIYEQNNAGSSIDCDLMALSSVLPLGDSITFLTRPEVKYNSIMRVLKKEGYTSYSSHPEDIQDFNWGKAHKAALGTENLWPVTNYMFDESEGPFGMISDRTYLKQFVEKLENVSKPFYGLGVTISSHGPFDLKDESKMLNLPEDLNGNILGKYFQSLRYTDEQIGKTIESLEKKGMLDDAMVVIYGDHAGVHKYYNSKLEDVKLEGDWWKDTDKKVPLIIYNKDLQENKIEAYGGQIDIMPTVLYLLGVEDNLYRDKVMGRVLVNTKRNYTVIKDNEIRGEINSEEEEKHIKSAYDIGRKIILNHYYEKKNLLP